ncbi:hypothetical protein AMECASPLE_015772 [Ameca splendens]|uniref:Protein naked cuticle homolog n=1 Tax=Ameca splendens TaxID=208324 RepID=A0ABV0XF24_9TELE
MGKLHSKHAAICKPRESPEGDSFVVNACLAKKGVDDWLVKQKYYCTSSRLGQQDCDHKGNCGLTARVSPTGLFHKAGALVKKLKALFKFRLLFLSLASFLSSPSALHFLFPPAGLLCMLCDVYLSPTMLYPLCGPKGPRTCCCSLKGLGENFGATL